MKSSSWQWQAAPKNQRHARLSLLGSLQGVNSCCCSLMGYDLKAPGM